jgi:CDP-diacylglycerol--glycerol-3-phosphate 3-phosphatidyltransferase
MATRVVPAPLAQLPNALTILRLLAIPVFVALLLRTDGEGSYVLAGLFAAAALTDQVDGYLARRWRVESEFGKFADPLADRLMIDAAVLLLCLDGRLPWIALAIVLARDALLIGGYGLVKDRGYEFSVSALGKASTWVLYAAIVGVIASDEGTEWPLALFWSGVGLAVLAAVFYVLGAVRAVEE